ncbi:iron-containing alcohol dehydrogenase family protein [Bifidobacterium cuniculi]|uniref:Oxidoreductase n=1 Tax=Bifidobacterium cuniculi TaxID=1688 RepID=A0A087AL35_9BIFI|nr:iron-containing alcohol dehydrogenase family protein [Bifidobacterium cuniculi]KFI59485.1 oxidoreductase [Bifidobacterium cuniculi]
MATFVQDTDVRSGPDRVISTPGVAKQVERYLEDYRRPVIITGERSAAAFLDYVGEREFFAPILRYDGTSSERNARELAEQAKALDADVIVAIGAGKLSDTAKNTAEFLDLDLVIVPTLACACAAYSPFSVNYDDQHRYLGIPIHPRNSQVLLIDSALIARAGADKLVGGIGDTLAKWYESTPVFEQAGDVTVFDRLSHESARLVRDLLLTESVPALEAVRAGDYDNDHVRTLIDTIIGLAGCVGGFGGVRARESGAHSVHDGLTRVPGSAESMHGEKVAYGVLVQLLTEGKEDEARKLLPFFAAVGLPTSWRRMGLDFTDEHRRTVADFASAPESPYHAAVPGVTSEQIIEAMETLEAM